MTPNGTVQGDADRQWRKARRPTPLIRPDRARAIDRIIDYFGGGGRWPAPVARLDMLPAPWSEGDQ